MTTFKPFSSLKRDEKIQFFLKCQQIGAQYHPNSPYTVTRDSIKTFLDFYKKISQEYRGYIYEGENVCALFNLVEYNPSLSMKESLASYIYQPPHEKYNAVLIDFLAARNLRDSIELKNHIYHDKIQFILAVRNFDLEVIPVKKMLERLK